jgi:TRAP transporter TAXI family solute receptor
MGALLIALSAAALAAQPSADGIGMVTGPKTGTAIQLAMEMAQIAQRAGVELVVKASEGSLDNIRRLVSAENAGLGFVQADVLDVLTRSADPQVRRTVERLRLVFPLHDEEVHLLARTAIRRLEELQGRRVVVGTRGSGTWLTAQHLLRLLQVQPAERLEMPPPEGVRAVLRGDADAVFEVGGKPVRLFTNILELQRDPRYAALVAGVHFVPVDQPAVRRHYAAASLGPEDYPWVRQRMPTVAVKALLISADFSNRRNPHSRRRCQQLARLATALREHLAELQRTGHPKWREVDLDGDLSLWKPDLCVHPASPSVPRPSRREDDLFRGVTDLLKRGGRAP